MARHGGTSIAAAIAVATACLAPGVRAQARAPELTRFLHDDAVATVHLRSFYGDRTNARPPNNVAWAGGGWLGYESGWLFDTLQLGAVGYTTQPLWVPAGAGNTLALKPGGYGFWTLGQAYASLKVHDQVFTGFRQSVDELEVNPHDSRMVPNTFEAYALRGAVGGVRYFAGYVAAIKTRNSSDFVNMAERAGAPNVNAGMELVSLKYGSLDALRLRASAYRVPDILTSSYGDVARTFALDEGLHLRFAGQAMFQDGGVSRPTGAFETWAVGGRGDILWHGIDVWGALTQIGAGGAWRAPYGQWLGFTHQMERNFDSANERAVQAGLGYDFTGIALPGLQLMASATFGSGAMTASTGAVLPTSNEYDFDVTYSLAATSLPGWLKPLQLRGRYGHLDQRLNGNATTVDEVRLILNYELSFKGSGRP